MVMLTAHNEKKQKIIGWDARKGDVYYCPSCEEKLILRQGEIKVHHFAHVAETKCQYEVGETQEHLWMKKYLYQKFIDSNLYKDVELEYKTGNQIADIYLVNSRDKKIAVECQISSLDIAEFRRKTAYYSYQGIYTLWIFSGNNELEKRLIKLVYTKGSRLNYTSCEVDLKCHRWYYGRFYYFYNDNIYAIHFHPIENWVPSSCDECLEQFKCPHTNPAQCPKYRAGYFRRPRALKEISIHLVYPTPASRGGMRLVCIDRKDKLRIAKFNEPTWWKV